MAKMIKLLSTAVFMIIAQMAWASSVDNIALNVIDLNSLQINFGRNDLGQAKFTIVDLEGEIVFQQKGSSEEIEGKKYNLKYLKDGQYKVIIGYGRALEIKTISFDNGAIQIDAEEDVVYFPTLTAVNGSVNVNMLCDDNVDYTMAVRDQDGNVVYDEVISADAAFHKSYNFNKLNNGTYEVAISLEGDLFKEDFTTSVEVKNDVLAVATK